MKVLLLGCGVMGGGGVKALQHFGGIESMVVADLDLAKAQELASELDYPHVEAVQLDATDTDRVKELAKDADIVFNSVGPFTHFAVPILKAVIEAGADYVDVCDDADATEDLLELHDMAKEAGVTALLAMGQTPGVANMQAKYLSEQMDDIDVLKIAWACDSPDVDMVRGTDLEASQQVWADILGEESGETFKRVSRAGWDHLVHSMANDIPVYKDGKFTTMPAWDSGEYVDFGQPMGRFPVFYVGHSEPVTLPRYIKINDFCACLGGNIMHKALRLEAKGYEEPKHPLVDPGTPVWETSEAWKDLGCYQGQAAIAEGTKDGKKVRMTNRYMCSVYDRGAYTFAGQAIGIHLVGKMRDMKEKPTGVFAPEGLLDTQQFNDALVELTNKMNHWDLTYDELVPTQIEEL